MTLAECLTLLPPEAMVAWDRDIVGHFGESHLPHWLIAEGWVLEETMGLRLSVYTEHSGQCPILRWLARTERWYVTRVTLAESHHEPDWGNFISDY